VGGDDVEADRQDPVQTGDAIGVEPPADDVARRRGRDLRSIVDCGLYVDGERRSGQLGYAEAFEQACRIPNAFVWLALHDPKSDEFADIAATFGLHELAVEDAVMAAQRPKLERYGSVTFVVVKTALYLIHEEVTHATELVQIGDVMVFVGANFVITVRHGFASQLRRVRAQLESRPDLLVHGPWAVFHAVTDQIVDTYVEVVDAIEDDIEELEGKVFSRDTTDIQRIYQLKREVVQLKRAVMPLARPLDGLTGGVVTEVPQRIREYIRDIADHHHRVTDQIASYDDLLNSILTARLAQTGVQQNNDMRKISAWVAIGAVPTAAAGIYGMNFDFMPELRWRFGYPVVLVVVMVICGLLYRQFKRTGWL
jgi:magnesium transporter